MTPSEIADAYHGATAGDAWYGYSLRELLAKVPPRLATVPPVTGAHAISELLQHLLLWNERVRETSKDHPLPKWEPEKEWAEPAIEWGELMARWDKSRDSLEEKIRKFPVAELTLQVPGRTYDYAALLRGTVEHTIYHSGQIAMVLSMLTSK